MESVEGMLRQGVEAHQSGRLNEARQVSETILRLDPKNPNALNLLGMVHHHQGRHAHAHELISRAIEAAPQVSGFHNNLGAVCLAQRRCVDAEAALRRAVALQPEYPEAINNLAVALMGQGLFEKAMPLLAHCLELRPVYPSARNNLGNALRARRFYGEAIDCYRDAIAQQADHADSWSNLAIAQLELGELEDAEKSARRAMALRPDEMACQTLGFVLEAKGRTSEAIAVFETLLAHRPEAELARFHLASLKGQAGYDAIPPAYVRLLFDQYCDVFDEHLVKRLNYRGPELLAEAVAGIGLRTGLDVADLGCGTGLCGALFRSVARRLVGVDLSPRMIHYARKRDLYDELIVQELSAFLDAHVGAFDLLLAADVLIYFGELGTIFQMAEASLREGGLFAFTLEKARQEDGDYRLQASRRFSHSSRYIGSTLAAARLEVMSMNPCVLRTEAGRDVEGWIVVAKKTGGVQS